MTSIQTELWVDRARAAVAFYEAAFGAKVIHRVGEGDDIVAQLRVDDAVFWVTAASAPMRRLSPNAIGATTSRTLLVVDNPEQVVAQALVAGATEASAVEDEHGWRIGRIVDPFGHEWEIGKPLGAWPPSQHELEPDLPTLLFVHGACVRDADWWWSPMIQPLAERGIRSAAVALPSCGETGDALGDLAADVQACREAIREAEGPVVLCGHSYGGVVITEAGADKRVVQLIYITSVMPDAGQSQSEMIGGEPAPWLQPDEDTVGVDPDMIREYFLQDCDQVTVEQAIARLTRQSLAPFAQPPREIAWRSIPSSYIVCTQDLATPAETQRGRIRAGTHQVEFDAGHHPFLARPDAFAGVLAEEISAAITATE